MLAIFALVSAVVAITIVVHSSGGTSEDVGAQGTGGGRRAAGSGPGGAGQSAPSDPGSKLVRNATPQPDWRPSKAPVPILAYHELGAVIPNAPYPELFTSRPEFRAEMNWLDDHGYDAVTLAEVEKAWFDGGTLPAKPVVISFDDGYRPQFTFGLPELRRHGWPGVLNVKAEGSDLYTSNIEAMIAAGWEVASHTINHLDLTTLSDAELRHELVGSRSILRRDYGVPVDNFCYPSGQFDDRVEAAVKAAGYTAATTEVPGFASREDPYALDRFEMLGSSGVAGLASFMRSG